MIHSVPAPGEPLGCASWAGPVGGGLRDLVLGYSGFRSATGLGVQHRLLPFSVVVLVLDIGADGLVTGARDGPGQDGPARWGCGVTIGLTPRGVRGLLGVPMRELTGRTVGLSDLVGARAGELTERLAAVGPAVRGGERSKQVCDRREWVAILDSVLGDWAPGRGRSGERDAGTGGRRAVDEAWRRIHRGGATTVGALAGRLGVGRRGLERGFRDEFGLSPGAVGRIVRFQRAVGLLANGAELAAAAAESGFADQPHLNRESRVLAGTTPGELRAIFQYGTSGAA